MLLSLWSLPQCSVVWGVELFAMLLLCLTLLGEVVPIIWQSGSNCPIELILSHNINHFFCAKNTVWSQFSDNVVLILLMTKIFQVMWTTKYLCFVIVCPFVLKIIWYVWTNILMQVKEIDIETWEIKGYDISKKKEVRNLVFRWFYHSDLLYLFLLYVFIKSVNIFA